MMSRQRYKETMQLRAAYMKGIKTEETRAAHAQYAQWQKARLVHYMRRKYGKWSDYMKAREIEAILKTGASSDQKILKIKKVMSR